MPCWWCAHRRKGHPLSGQPQHCTAWPSASDLPLPAPGPVAAVLPLGAHPPCRRPPAAACSPGPGRGTRQRPAERGAAGWAYRLQARRRGPAQAAPRCKARRRRPTRSSGGGGCTPAAHLQVPHDARGGGKGGDRGDERGGGDGRHLVHRLLGVALCFARRTLLLQLLRRRLLRAAGPARNDWAAGAARSRQPTLSRLGLGAGRPRSHTALLHMRGDLPVACSPTAAFPRTPASPTRGPNLPNPEPRCPAAPQALSPTVQLSPSAGCCAYLLRGAGPGHLQIPHRAPQALRRPGRQLAGHPSSKGAAAPQGGQRGRLAPPSSRSLHSDAGAGGGRLSKEGVLAATTALRIGCR